MRQRLHEISSEIRVTEAKLAKLREEEKELSDKVRKRIDLFSDPLGRRTSGFSDRDLNHAAHSVTVGKLGAFLAEIFETPVEIPKDVENRSILLTLIAMQDKGHVPLR